jgi:lysophospholipase L1-like esterase
LQQPWRRRLKTVVFSIVPALVLLGGAEIVFRLCFPLPEIVPFTPEVYEDRDLFWRVKPNLNVVSPRTTKLLRTNELGFRDKPIGPKGESEFRVLCLGESTTYGDYVEFDETYAQVAQRRLNEKSSGIRYRVINAGAPSYSSFQSLVLLKKYGLDLKPDAVVLYHEGNDYLPVGWDKRDVTALTDPQRYAGLQRAPWLWWFSRLRIYRVPVAWLHRREPDPQLLDRVYGMFGHRLSDVQTRLTVEQQYETLDEFRTLCAQHHIQLLLMHPTYFSTGRHDCPLTDFARRNGVPLLETVQLFPATVQARKALFADAAHPNADGHRRIGEALAEFLLVQDRPGL